MCIVILDENLVEIDRLYLSNDFNIKKVKKIKNPLDIDKLTKEFLDNFDSSLGVYSYINSLNSFYISFLNDSFLDLFSCDLTEIKGIILSELFAKMVNQGRKLVQIFKQVYNTNQPQKLYGDYYKEDTLCKRFEIKLVKIGNFICTIHKDITKQLSNENQLKEALDNSIMLEKNLKKIQKISKTSLCYINHEDYDNVIWFNSGYNILDIKPEEYSGNLDDYLIEEDKNVWIENHAKCTPEHPEVSFIQRAISGKNELKYIKTFVAYEFDKEGNKIYHVNFYQDITEEVKRGNRLGTALKDKELLLTEVHHRVKNNLQIIISLINLDKNYESNSEVILNDTESRIYAMALIHEKIYESPTLSDVNMKEYIQSLVDSLITTYESEIKLCLNMKSIEINMEEAIPLGLIINELVTNTIKYAYPNNEGNLYINFEKNSKHCVLTVKDDGIGLPVDFNLDTVTSLGLIVVQNLTMQMGGILSVVNCKGTGFKIEFDEE